MNRSRSRNRTRNDEKVTQINNLVDSLGKEKEALAKDVANLRKLLDEKKYLTDQHKADAQEWKTKFETSFGQLEDELQKCLQMNQDWQNENINLKAELDDIKLQNEELRQELTEVKKKHKMESGKYNQAVHANECLKRKLENQKIEMKAKVRRLLTEIESET